MITFFKQTKKQTQRLPLVITMLGEHHLQEPVYRPNGMYAFQWFFCEKGSGEFVISGQKMILKAGQALLLYPDVPHHYHAITDDWTLSFIGFTGENPTSLLITLGMQESGIYKLSQNFNYTDFFQRIKEAEILSPSSRNRALSVICYDFLLQLAFHSHFSSSASLDSENEIVAELIRYMEAHYPEPISIDQLAEEVGFSRGYTQTLFKKEIGHTLGKHLEIIRLVNARLMLTQYPEKRVADIARDCGFVSPSYFGKVFKRQTGKSPAEYRLTTS